MSQPPDDIPNREASSDLQRGSDFDPSQASYDRVYQTVHSAWKEAHVKPSRISRVLRSISYASAACFVLGIAMIVLQQQPVQDRSVYVAHATKVVGEVRYVDHPLSLVEGVEIETQYFIETSQGAGLALVSDTGASLRVDENTRFRLLSSKRLELVHGAIYFDSRKQSNESNIEVLTDFGSIQDIGTQFEVRLSPETLVVGVREGEVVLKHPSDNITSLSAKEKLVISQAGNKQLTSISPDGVEWSWAQALAEPFEFDGYSLSHFLDQFSRENGWDLRYTTKEVEHKAQSTLLHGSIRGLETSEILEMLPLIGSVSYELKNWVLYISNDQVDNSEKD